MEDKTDQSQLQYQRRLKHASALTIMDGYGHSMASLSLEYRKRALHALMAEYRFQSKRKVEVARRQDMDIV